MKSMYPQSWNLNAQDFYRATTREQQLQFLTRFGILAPSSHNTQPWRFKIKGNCIEVRANFSRKLPISDPDGRMLYEALGCAIENINIAADYYGLTGSVAYAEELNYALPECVAQIEFGARNEKRYANDLFQAIQKRTSNRGLYTNKPIEPAFFTNIERLNTQTDLSVVSVYENNDLKESIASLTGEGMRDKMSRRSFRWELARWLRTNVSKQADGMPGFGHGMPLFVSILAPFILRFVNVSRVEERKAIKRILNFPSICVISSRDDNALCWLKTGELLERILLKIYASGMAASIMVAAIETPATRKKLKELLTGLHQSVVSFYPQILFGFGYPAKEAPHSPRRVIEDVLI